MDLMKRTLNRIIFGEAEPNPGRKRVNLVGLGLIAAACYGYANDFIPSPGWMLWGFWLSMVVGVCLASIVVFVYATGRVPFYSEPSAGMKLLIYVFVSLLLIGLSWVIVVHSVGGFATTLFGTSVTMEVQAEKPSRLTKRKRRTCDYQILAGELESAFPSYLCANQWRYIQYPNNFKLVLHGKQSVFGYTVYSFEVKPN